MEALIAVTAIGFGVSGPVLAIYLLLLFSNKKTAKKMDTLVKIVEHGGNLEPGLLEMLNEPSGPAADLRKGLCPPMCTWHCASTWASTTTGLPISFRSTIRKTSTFSDKSDYDSPISDIPSSQSQKWVQSRNTLR